MNNSMFINPINNLDERDNFIESHNYQNLFNRKLLLECIPSIKGIEFVVKTFKKYMPQNSKFSLVTWNGGEVLQTTH